MRLVGYDSYILCTSERKVVQLRVESIRLETAVSQVADVPVVRATGEIDVYTAPDFKSSISQAMNSGAKNLVIDLTDVSYMDSSGFGTLLGATKRLRPKGGKINLVGCSEAIERMLKITRLDSIFGMFSSVDDALADLTG